MFYNGNEIEKIVISRNGKTVCEIYKTGYFHKDGYQVTIVEKEGSFSSLIRDGMAVKKISLVDENYIPFIEIDDGVVKKNNNEFEVNFVKKIKVKIKNK